jgi:hypothetical protein
MLQPVGLPDITESAQGWDICLDVTITALDL